MKILLLALDFYGYTRELIAELERRGHEVAFFEIRPFVHDEFRKYRFKTDLGYRKKALARYADKIIEKTEDIAFDLVLAISVNTFLAEDLGRILAPQRKAVKIYFMWDSLANFPFMLEHFPLFDKVYSFDLKDCKEHGLIYQPTWASGNAWAAAKLDIVPRKDITFIAVLHPERYFLSERLKKQCRKEGLRYAPYLYIRSLPTLFYLMYKTPAMRRAPLTAFRYRKLRDKAKTRRLSLARATVDVPYGRQVGLTQRIIEALVLRRKVITTNAAVREFALYCPENVLVVDGNDFSKVTAGFLSSPFKDYEKSALERFSVGSFVDNVVEGNLPK